MLVKLKQQVLIIILALVLGVCGIGFYVFLERRGKKVSSERESFVSSLEQVMDYQQKLSDMHKRLSELEVALEDFDENIPSERDLGPFLHKIAVLMDKHSLKEQRVEPGKEIEGEKINSIPVEMECRGGIRELYDFYESLEGLKRLIRIEEINLVNSTDFTGELEMHTRAKIFFRAERSKG